MFRGEFPRYTYRRREPDEESSSESSQSPKKPKVQRARKRLNMRNLQGGQDVQSVAFQAQIQKLEQQKARNQQLELIEKTRSHWRKRIDAIVKQKTARTAVLEPEKAHRKIGYKNYTWQQVGPHWRAGSVVLNRYDQPEYQSPWMKIVSNLLYSDDLYKLPTIGYYEILRLEVPEMTTSGVTEQSAAQNRPKEIVSDEDDQDCFYLRIVEDCLVNRKVLGIEWQQHNPRIEEIIAKYEAVNREDSESVSGRSISDHKKLRLPVLDADPDHEADKSTLRLPSSTDRGMIVSGDEMFSIAKKGYTTHHASLEPIDQAPELQSVSGYLQGLHPNSIDSPDTDRNELLEYEFKKKLEQRRENRREAIGLPKLNLQSLDRSSSQTISEEAILVEGDVLPGDYQQTLEEVIQEHVVLQHGSRTLEEPSAVNQPTSSLNSGHFLSALLISLPDSVYDLRS